MAKRWTVGVLLALATTAQAQYPPPMGVPAPPMMPTSLPAGMPINPMFPMSQAPAAGGQPMPVGSSALPQHQQQQPPAGLRHPGGPPPESPLSLSGSGLNAWNDDGYSTHLEGCYFTAGFMALLRPDLGHSVLAFSTPNLSVDQPTLPGRFANVALDFNDLGPRPLFGGRGTLGYRYGAHAIELTGFYNAHSHRAVTLTDPGRLAVPFAAFLPPPGFAGNNNLWLNADRVEASYHADFGSVEFNYRAAALGGIDCIVGIRYVDYKDFFGVLTDDDGITTFGNLTNIADYRVSSHSHFVAPQVGFECFHDCCCNTALGFVAKGAWGINFNDVAVDLERGDFLRDQNDPLRRQHGRRSEAIFSMLYELGIFADMYCCDNVKLRLGYQMFLLSNFPQAHEQVHFNIRENPTGHRRDQSLILYHGPSLELGVQF